MTILGPGGAVLASGTSSSFGEVVRLMGVALPADGTYTVRVKASEGQPDSGWVLLDYGDVLVHVFLEDTRAYYALERLWGDVPSVPVDGA